MREFYKFYAIANVLIASLLFPFVAVSQCDPLETLYVGDNGQDGIMFDITALVDVTVTGFDANLGDAGPYTMEIYYKAGTHVGFTTNAAAWTLVGTTSNLAGLGLDIATPIPILLNAQIPAGQTGAFYITETGGAPGMDYTNGTAVGAVYITDGNISVLEGTGKEYAFGADYTPRIPNITVYFDCCPLPTLVETNNSCVGVNNGTVEITGEGTGPWVYEIADLSGTIETTVPINGPYLFENLGEGQYVLTATDAIGCTAGAQVELIPAYAMTIDAAVQNNLCFGGSLGQVTANVVNGTPLFDIAWSDAFGILLQEDFGTSGTAFIDSLPAADYIIAAEDSVGCQALLNVTVGEPATAVTLTLTPQDLSCFEQGDGEVEASQDGVSPYTYDIADQFGVPISSGADVGNYTFTNLDAGIHFITVVDDDGCEATEVVELFEPDLLEVQTATSPVLCVDGDQGIAIITSISGGTTPYAQITWDDPTLQTGDSAVNLFAGTYVATVMDANGCSLDTSFVLENPPHLLLTPSYNTDTCGQGKGAAIINVQLGEAPYTFLWKPDSVDLSIHYGLTEGSYEVVVTDVNGCKDSTFVEVSDDLSYPTADFDYRIHGENVLAQEVQFLNNSLGTTQWQWNFGNGESSNDENPTYSYGRAGDYLVQLIAATTYCEDTTYQYVNIDPMLLVYIPNAFTPGINGKNDYFFPQGEGIELESYDMFIFDRWGKQVWQTGNFSKKWDGTNMYSLEPVPVGTYTYFIKFREYADLDRHEYKGVVHVLRD